MARWSSFTFVCNELRFGILGGERAAWPDNLDWAEVAEVCRHHRVIAPLAWCLRNDERVPDAWSFQLKSALAVNAMRNQILLRDLERIVAALNTVGLEPVLLKGAAYLVDGLYPAPGLRFLTDIDVLVPEQQLHRAEAAMLALAFEPPPRKSWVEIDHQHLPRMTHAASRIGVELHKSVFSAGEEIIPLAQFCRETRAVSFRGLKARVPDATQAVAHNIAHAQISHNLHWERHVEVRQLLDLALIRARDESSIEWPEIERCFVRSGFGSVLADNLKMAEVLFGQALPPLEAMPRRDVVASLRRNVERPQRRRRAKLGRVASRYFKMLRARPAGVFNLLAPGLWPPRLRLLLNACRPRG
jgi:hypothetical protein